MKLFKTFFPDLNSKIDKTALSNTTKLYIFEIYIASILNIFIDLVYSA